MQIPRFGQLYTPRFSGAQSCNVRETQEEIRKESLKKAYGEAYLNGAIKAIKEFNPRTSDQQIRELFSSFNGDLNTIAIFTTGIPLFPPSKQQYPK